MKTVLVLAAILVVNVFFGYWRSNTRRFSGQWILAIHTPVPVAIGLRLLFLGWSWLLPPVFVGAFAIGQYPAGQIRRLLRKRKGNLTSFLAVDIVRALPRGSSISHS
jgi:hypothetical protein